MINIEEWKPIKDYEGLYEVSNLGRVRGLDRKVENRTNIVKGRILKLKTTRLGYYAVSLQNQKIKWYTVHRLVAQAFIPNPENKPFVDHINNNGLDNRVENLQWCTQSENIKYSFERGRDRMCPNLIWALPGEKHFNAKLKDSDVKYIRSIKELSPQDKIELSKKYNVHIDTIYNVINYKTYKNVKV